MLSNSINRSASLATFSTHRMAYNPRPSLYAGRPNVPTAWQNRETPQSGAHHQYGAPVRSFGEILFAPFRKIIIGQSRKYVLGAVILMALLTIIF
ncbi:MAG: hypothetical protein ACSHWY_11195 [Octadecabacter sp.]